MNTTSLYRFVKASERLPVIPEGEKFIDIIFLPVLPHHTYRILRLFPHYQLSPEQMEMGWLEYLPTPSTDADLLKEAEEQFPLMNVHEINDWLNDTIRDQQAAYIKGIQTERQRTVKPTPESKGTQERETVELFGKRCSIEQKRFGVPNEQYTYKIVDQLESNTWVEVPVQTPEKEVLHEEMEKVVGCICDGISQREVFRFRLSDVKIHAPKTSQPTDVSTETAEDIKNQVAIENGYESWSRVLLDLIACQLATISVEQMENEAMNRYASFRSLKDGELKAAEKGWDAATAIWQACCDALGYDTPTKSAAKEYDHQKQQFLSSLKG